MLVNMHVSEHVMLFSDEPTLSKSSEGHLVRWLFVISQNSGVWVRRSIYELI